MATPSPKETFRENRLALARDLADGLILVAGDELTPRNHDVSYVFRQNSNFLYLTGVEDPGYALLLDPKRKKEILFVPRVDQRHRVWEGHVPDLDEHVELYGIRQARYVDELPTLFGKLAGHHQPLYTDQAGRKLLRSHGIMARADRSRFQDALEFCRVEKHEGELALMKRANAISARGHEAAMAAARPGMYEYEVQAVLEGEFLRGGAKHHAYPSIVAGGTNAACLHYRCNDQKLGKGDLLLIDAGCEVKGYASDITRTFPVSGRFSPEQKDVYQVVLEAQLACIAAARNGVRNSELHLMSQKILAAGLHEMGVLESLPQEAVETGAISVFYPHGVGHMLGLDVHDVNGGRRHRFRGKRPKNLRNDCVLRPGMVITIEPGLYFIPALMDDREVRKRHDKQIRWGKADRLRRVGGIRIEDNVVIRDQGPPRNLTTVPKTVADVEAACQRASG